MRQICPIRRTWLRRSARYTQSADPPRVDGYRSSPTDVPDSTSDIGLNANRRFEGSSDIQGVGEAIEEDAVRASNENGPHVPEDTFQGNVSRGRVPQQEVIDG